MGAEVIILANPYTYNFLKGLTHSAMALLWLYQYQLGGACMLGVRTYLAGILISWKTEHTRLLWQEGPIDNIKYKGTGKKV